MKEEVVSKQVRWQRKMKQQGRCVSCGRRRDSKSLTSRCSRCEKKEVNNKKARYKLMRDAYKRELARNKRRK